MPFAAGKLYRLLGRHYLWLYVWFEVATALVIGVATVGLFALYTEPTSEQFWRIVVVAETLVAVALVYTVAKAIKMAKPLAQWLRTRDPDGAFDAWHVAITIPRRLVFVNGWKPFAIISLPSAIFFTAELDLPAYSALIVFGGACLAVAAGVLHFFAGALPPAGRRTSPSGCRLTTGSPPACCPLEAAWRAADHQRGHRSTRAGWPTTARFPLNELGLDVIVAIGIAFTVSLEMTILITKSVTGPIKRPRGGHPPRPRRRPRGAGPGHLRRRDGRWRGASTR